MNDDEPSPQPLQVEWDRRRVMALFDDLAAGAEIQQVQLRTLSVNRSVSLPDAVVAFADGAALAIQIRYRYEGSLWCDSIFPGDPFTKIVRCGLPCEERDTAG
jgi:hypothetical protein